MSDNLFSTIPGGQIVTLLVGITLLTLGRRIFWLAVAAIGFILGLSLG